MLSRSIGRLCFAAMAADAARRYAADHRDAPPDAALWHDDTAAERLAYEHHIRSPAYRELHRPALSNAAMGLYGGEPGFEKAYRVWVDPDRPHMKHVYNQTALAKNLRYARYGYFKRDMHILDIDKLVRHARLLPTPGRLLTDFLYQRVPLPDKSCAALIRYQRQQIEMLEEWERHSSFQCAAEMFERLIVTNIPPVDIGVETHAEMVLCAAASGKWEEGWDVYAARAREMEAESPDSFALNTYFFDALLTLCVTARRIEEGMSVMEETITRSLRPRSTMLDKAMMLCAMGAENLSKEAEEEAKAYDNEGQKKQHPQQHKERWEELERRGLELWALYDFYQLPRTTASVEAYMRMCCAFEKPTLVLRAQSFADASGIRLSMECFHWLVYALRGVADFGDYVMDVFSQLTPRGLTPDIALFTVAFMYCALQRDGELALAIYDQHFLHMNMNPTPEMTLLFIQACTHCDEPRVVMLERCEAIIQRLELVGSSVDHISLIYDQFLELCAHLGAVATGFGVLKRLVGFGKPFSTRMLNSLLQANANATPPNGSLGMTEEIVRLFTLLKVQPNKDTLICVRLCAEAFGDTPAIKSFTAAMESQLEADGETVSYDVDIPVLQVPPHELRQLRTEWKLQPRDTVLRRFGQHTKPPGKGAADVGSMVGSVIPFGRSPVPGMLQWEWPKTWSPESKEVIRTSIEKAIRKSMEGGKNAQIRGTVSVGELNLGCIPPEVALSGIRVLSAEHTAIMVKFRYNGDFSVQLCGLEINLDTVGASAEEADENYALPFFCPFEMTLQGINLDGMVSIEVFHELEEDPQQGQDCAVAVHTAVAPRVGKSSSLRPPRSARSASARGRSGYGVLLGSGGRRAMRPPGVLDTIEGSLSSLDTEQTTGATLRSSTHMRSGAPSFADIMTKKVLVKRRMVKAQLFGDPLKSFRVVSNFGTVPGANSKVEGTIRMLIKPAIEKLMVEGIVFTM